MMKGRLIGAVLLTTAICPTTPAQQNDTFETATVLPPGVLSVADELTQRMPDTRLGIRNPFGIFPWDDNNSIYGNGQASGLQGVSVGHVNGTGSINFIVTGTDDFGFDGSHQESGRFEVFLDVYDAAEVHVAAFSETRVLQLGSFHEFTYADPGWLGGRYDVNIDNALDANDIDFFTFTGLAPETEFVAEIQDPDGSGIEGYLGWFDDTGELLTSNGGVLLPLLAGTVPTSGRLTLAVTGFGDTSFIGAHHQRGSYVLKVAAELDSIFPLPGDYCDDGAVAAADYTVWRDTLGQTGPSLPADGNGDHVIDFSDYTIWKSNFGATATGSVLSAASVPEPATPTAIIAVLLCVVAACRDRHSPRCGWPPSLALLPSRSSPSRRCG